MIVSLITGIFGSKPASVNESSKVQRTLTSNFQYERQIQLEYNGSKLEVVWAEIEDSSKVDLHLNLKDKKTAVSASSDFSCKVLVNGGFYNKEGEPIGLFVSEGNSLSAWQENSLFNGVLGITKDGKPQVNEQGKGFVDAVQAGPVLVREGVYKELSIKNDGTERRVVGVVTKEEKLIFLSFYNPTSYYLGPNLEDVPGLLKSFGKETGIQIKDAINLDGGTASAFYAEGVSLTELRPIGSYFCAKD